MEVSLPPEMANLIQQKIASGRFRAAEDVIGAGLRLLDKQEAEKLDELRREIMIGYEQLQRGEGTPLDREAIENIKAAGRERLRRKQEEA